MRLLLGAKLEERMFSPRFIARILLAFDCAITLAPTASAQAWPARPLRLIVNIAAGGSTEVCARSMSSRW